MLFKFCNDRKNIATSNADHLKSILTLKIAECVSTLLFGMLSL